MSPGFSSLLNSSSQVRALLLCGVFYLLLLVAIDRCLLVAASKFPARLVMLVFPVSATFWKKV